MHHLQGPFQPQQIQLLLRLQLALLIPQMHPPKAILRQPQPCFPRLLQPELQAHQLQQGSHLTLMHLRHVYQAFQQTFPPSSTRARPDQLLHRLR